MTQLAHSNLCPPPHGQFRRLIDLLFVIAPLEVPPLNPRKPEQGISGIQDQVKVSESGFTG